MTLTIDKIGKKETKDYICAVDMNTNIINHLKKITKKEIKNISHWLIFNEKEEKLPYEKKQEIIEEYTKKPFEERTKYVEKNSRLSLEKRMEKVEEILKIYQNASLVITDRIHVALPCLALETPVLLIYYDKNEDRIKTFKEFITNCNENQFLKYEEKDLLKVKNNDKYKEYREKLNKKVQEFLEDEQLKEFEKELIEPDVYKNEVIGKIHYLESLYIGKINSQKKEIEDLHNDIQTLNKIVVQKERKNNKLQEKYNKAEKICYEYSKIKNSRSWKIIGNYYEKSLEKNEEVSNK